MTAKERLPWRNRILTRTLVVMLAISLLPLLFVGGATVYFEGRDAEQEAEGKLLDAAEEMTSRIENYIAQMSEDMEFIVKQIDQDDFFSRKNHRKNNRLFSAFTATHADIQAIWAVDEKGRKKALFSRKEMVVSEEPIMTYERDIHLEDRGVIWHATERNMFGEHFAIASVSIMLPWQTQSRGAMFFKFRLDNLQKAIKCVEAEGAGTAFVMDKGGQLISHTDRSKVLSGLDVSEHLRVEQELGYAPEDSGPRLWFHRNPEGEDMLAAFQRISPQGWMLVVETSLSEAYRMRDRIIWLTAAGFFIVILLVVPVAVMFSYRLTNPVKHLLKATGKLAAGDLDARAKVTTNDEIGVFAETFNRMAEFRQEAEKALDKERKRLSVTLQSIGDAVIATDTRGVIVLINKVAETLTGWDSASAAGRPLDEVFHIINEKTRQRCINPVEKVLESGLIVGLANHTALIARDGSEIPISDSGSPIRGSDGRIVGVVLVFRDITERKLAEAEAMRSSQLASLGELAAGVAHEINNPINVIINYAQLIADRSEPQGKRFSYSNNVIKEGNRIAKIVGKMLSFARGGGNDKEPSDVHTILSDTLVLLDAMLRKDSINLIIEPKPDPVLVNAKFEQLQQVFLNIITNARHALNKKYPHQHEDKVLEMHTEEVTDNNKRYVDVMFHDRGTGMSEEVREKAMRPFFTTKISEGGTGLGLSISHGIVADHDGSIRIESRVGEFTRVTVRLPVVVEKA